MNGRQSIRPGLHFMVAAAFFFSLMSLLVKLAGRRLPSSEIVFARSAVSLVVSWVLVRRARISLWGKRRSLLLLRGLAGFCALLCFFYAVTRLPLAHVTVIHFTNPVFTAVFAAVFLGETLGWRDGLGLGTSLGGVLLVAQPEFLFGRQLAGVDLLAVGLALTGSMLSAIAYISVRKLRETDHPLVVVFYFPLLATPLSIPIMAPSAIWPTPVEWTMLIGIGLVTQIAQVCLTKGLHSEPAGRAMAVGYVQIVFAALWGVLFFDEFPNTLGMVGAVLVVGGTLLVGRRWRPG